MSSKKANLMVNDLAKIHKAKLKYYCLLKVINNIILDFRVNGM